jgi:hypothetical protein
LERVRVQGRKPSPCKVTVTTMRRVAALSARSRGAATVMASTGSAAFTVIDPVGEAVDDIDNPVHCANEALGDLDAASALQLA